MLQPARHPEILEADLAPLVLELSNWGVNDLSAIAWATAPPSGAVNQAKELLAALGAIDDGGITAHGRAMLRLPAHPRIAHMLLSREALRALASDVAALLEERDPLDKQAGADIVLRIEALRKWRQGQRVNADIRALERIGKSATAWRRLLDCPVDNNAPAHHEVGALIAEAYPERIAKQLDKFSVRYKLVNARVVRLPEHDPLIREPWLAIADVDSGQQEGRIFLAAALHEDDFAHRATPQKIVAWDADKGMLIAATEYRIGNVVVRSEPLAGVEETERVGVLCQAIRSEGLRLLSFNDTASQWRARVSSLRHWRPDELWPDVSDEALLSSLEDWLAPYLTTVTKRQDFARLDLTSTLNAILSWEMSSRLNTLAPATIGVPSGSAIKVTYAADGSAPYMEVRLQEMFGLLETPAVNDGAMPVTLHLLSPGYKPVQVTQDLKSFWQTAYHEVRKELRRRYPKHHWPEDPWTAQAVRGVKRKV